MSGCMSGYPSTPNAGDGPSLVTSPLRGGITTPVFGGEPCHEMVQRLLQGDAPAAGDGPCEVEVEGALKPLAPVFGDVPGVLAILSPTLR